MEVGPWVGIILRGKNNLAPPEAPINNGEKRCIHEDAVVSALCPRALYPHSEYKYSQAVIEQCDQKMKNAKGINSPAIVKDKEAESIGKKDDKAGHEEERTDFFRHLIQFSKHLALKAYPSMLSSYNKFRCLCGFQKDAILNRSDAVLQDPF